MAEDQEAFTYSNYDSRIEFTKTLRERLELLYAYFMREDWNGFLKTAAWIYYSVRALFTTEERDMIEEALKKAEEQGRTRVPNQYQRMQNRKIGAACNTLIPLLHDAMHAHHLLIPHSSEDEDEFDEDRILAEAGL